jgi:hypothetical protein
VVEDVAGGLAYWKHTLLACRRPWVYSLELNKRKKKEEIMNEKRKKGKTDSKE